MIVIVGHGPSIDGAGLGPLIDRHTVIRLKSAPMPNAEDWGTMTDVVSTTSPDYVGRKLPGIEYWCFGPPQLGYRRPNVERWLEWFGQFHTNRKRRKPSNGLCAAMAAVEFLNPDAIGVIGFDSIMKPDTKRTGKWHVRKPTIWTHDQHAEHNALHALGPKIINLAWNHASDGTI